MSLAHDLLDQARVLAGLDVRRPKQANLRRSISAAYYALFHLLIADAIERIGPRIPSNLGPRIGRAFSHRQMKQVCRSISDSHASTILRELRPAGFSRGLVVVATNFANLQDERHRADYDLSAAYTRFEALEYVDLAYGAFREWKALRDHEEANVFLSALLFAIRWAK